MAVKPIPEGYHTITPYLVVDGAQTLIGFLERAFDARELMRLGRPDGGIGHAEVAIGDSRIMLADATSEYPRLTAMIHLYVEDTDAA
jgi:uncharacterized glyoxalase superfamily protein PhnB